MQSLTGKLFSSHGGAIFVIALLLILFVYGRLIAYLGE